MGKLAQLRKLAQGSWEITVEEVCGEDGPGLDHVWPRTARRFTDCERVHKLVTPTPTTALMNNPDEQSFPGVFARMFSPVSAVRGPNVLTFWVR